MRARPRRRCAAAGRGRRPEVSRRGGVAGRRALASGGTGSRPGDSPAPHRAELIAATRAIDAATGPLPADAAKALKLFHDLRRRVHPDTRVYNAALRAQMGGPARDRGTRLLLGLMRADCVAPDGGTLPAVLSACRRGRDVAGAEWAMRRFGAPPPADSAWAQLAAIYGEAGDGRRLRGLLGRREAALNGAERPPSERLLGELVRRAERLGNTAESLAVSDAAERAAAAAGAREGTRRDCLASL
eukprot:TRINITY_DN27585_c0_g1_i2.p1 TRINITY_DN27585_c0_g1~~TRINITY_DN27585_c0_g1_i2.p1  ORF type:complete len:244 (+),score=53.90 TRINITY_DN27585_c0_g1_i2:66-797(+)